MSEQSGLLDDLRAALHRDLDEGTISLVPPSVVIGALVGDDEEVALRVYCITYGYLLRRLVRGMDPDDAVELAESYLGMQPAGAWQQLRDMRRTCGYANGILAGTIPRAQALEQMMTWKNAERRVVEGLLEETFAVYRQEGLATFAPSELESVPDGDFRNGSFSTNAPHVALDFRRLLRHDAELGGMVRLIRWSAVIFVAILVGDIALFATGHWIIGLVLVPVLWFGRRFATLVLHLPKMKEAMTQTFENALLTPGIIEKVEPLTILCLAQMGNGGDAEYWGLKRLAIAALPLHALRRGEVFPCVSGFEAGDAEDHWVDFSPRPISWGTGDELKVKDLMMKLDQSEVETLKRLVKQGPLPTSEKLLILDQHFAPLRST